MDPAAILLAKIIAAAAGLALLVFACRRAVIWAKKSGGAELVVSVIMSFGFGGAINPVEQVVEEKRRLKRSEDEPGDPEERPNPVNG